MKINAQHPTRSTRLANWQKKGTIAVGGSVLAVATSRSGQVWLATGGGVVSGNGHGWSPLPQNRPYPLLTALAVSPDGRRLWAAGAGGGLAYTDDQGHQWTGCWIDQVAEPVVCLAVSPRWTDDGVMLAGTAGGGILRSTDRGRRWLVSNFGLQNFTVLSLATAPDWSRREVVLAGTESGLYRSSGGGRAWKPVGLPGQAVTAVAFSRHVAENGLALAASEAGGLFRSTDGGNIWQAVPSGPGGGVNCLLAWSGEGQEVWLAGTGGGEVWRSVDGGQQWQLVYRANGPVMALSAGASVLWMGLSRGGVRRSTDGGETWAPAGPLPGLSFQRLKRLASGEVVAVAPFDGVWLAAEDGSAWQKVAEASPDEPLFDIERAGRSGEWLAARQDGVWRLAAGAAGQAEPVLSGANVVSLLAGGGGMWAVAADSRVWWSVDGGDSWQAVSGPAEGLPLAAVAVGPAGELVGVSREEGAVPVLVCWRMAGRETEVCLRQEAEANAAVQVAAGRSAVWLAAGPALRRVSGGNAAPVRTFDQPVRRCVLAEDGESVVVLSGGRLVWLDGDAGRSVDLPEAGPAVDLVALPGGKVWLLDTAGEVWEGEGEW